jgi:Helix-turn-helix domain
MQEQLAYTVEGFISATKVGRTKAYEEIASGRLATYKVGRRRYISVRAIAEWQKRLEHEAIGAKSFWECA